MKPLNIYYASVSKNYKAVTTFVLA